MTVEEVREAAKLCALLEHLSANPRALRFEFDGQGSCAYYVPQDEAGATFDFMRQRATERLKALGVERPS